jgi:hypothetical protein
VQAPKASTGSSARPARFFDPKGIFLLPKPVSNYADAGVIATWRGAALQFVFYQKIMAFLAIDFLTPSFPRKQESSLHVEQEDSGSTAPGGAFARNDDGYRCE